MNDLLQQVVVPILSSSGKRNGKSSAIVINMIQYFSRIDISPGSTLTDQSLRDLAHGRDYSSREYRPGESATQKYLVVKAEMLNYDHRRGIEKEDLDEGIYHLKIGADKGIVKNFSFSEMNLGKYYRTMQIEKSNLGAGALVVPQNIELTTVGNQFFPNGTHIYIDVDQGFGRMLARKLGLGGYYGIIRSTHSITPQGYETVLSCVHQSDGFEGG